MNTLRIITKRPCIARHAQFVPVISVTLTVLFLSPPSRAHGAVTPGFQGLGVIPGGTFLSVANGVSADGSIVVGRGESASGTEAFIWTPSNGMTGLGDLPGGDIQSTANGISADGAVIVGHSMSASGEEAFRWTHADGMVGLGYLPGGDFSLALAGSSDGSTIVGWGSVTGTQTDPDTGEPILDVEAFRWTAETGMVGLGDLPGGIFNSVARDVSSDGSIVVGSSRYGFTSEAFRWTESEGMVGLGDLPGGGFLSAALGISDDGSTIVGSGVSALGSEAFRWTQAEGMIGLGDLPGGLFASEARAVSADGSIIVGSGWTEVGLEAFIWDEVNGMRNLREVLTGDLGLDLTGWVLTSARGISADGLTIVGEGINPNGDTEAFIARLPEPTTFAAVLALIPALLCRREAQRSSFMR